MKRSSFFSVSLRSLMTANFTHCVKFLATTLDPAVKPRDDGVRSEAIKGLRLASLVLCCLFLSSCGFHLRQHLLQIPVKRLQILPDDPYDPLQRLVRRDLTESGTTLVSEAPEATLHILSQNFKEQELALAEDGHVLAYLIIYEVAFSVDDRNGQPSLTRRTIKVSREMNNDLNTVLGQNTERAKLQEHLRERASQQMIHQMAVLSDVAL